MKKLGKKLNRGSETIEAYYNCTIQCNCNNCYGMIAVTAGETARVRDNNALAYFGLK